MSDLHGVIVVDKPAGPSSFGVVQEVRRALGMRRVGHGGTLDPMATGVLAVCVGEGTKIAGFFLGADKEYEAEVELGVATDTYDAMGQVTARCDASGVTEAQVRAALDRFLGPIRQRPPAYSAIKQDGQRLYARARAGEEVEAPERDVEIRQIEVLGLALPRVRFRVACSKGTYVRSLAADLGAALGVGAHLTALRRTRTGRFTLADAVALAALRDAHQAGTLRVLSPAEALAGLARVVVPAATERAVRCGQPLRAAQLGLIEGGAPGPLVILSARGDLVAVAEPPDGPEARVKLLRVFNTGAAAS
ncbi:MAG TPA: tRNA pseudouridine(55) synthase TruB [Polyangia bacterium]|jgi:tRNA pseudouridine55 synthase